MNVEGLEKLSPREKEIIKQWIEDGSNKLVAHHLGSKEQTIKNQITSILNKLDVVSIAQAAIHFDRWERGEMT